MGLGLSCVSSEREARDETGEKSRFGKWMLSEKFSVAQVGRKWINGKGIIIQFYLNFSI